MYPPISVSVFCTVGALRLRAEDCAFASECKSERPCFCAKPQKRREEPWQSRGRIAWPETADGVACGRYRHRSRKRYRFLFLSRYRCQRHRSRFPPPPRSTSIPCDNYPGTRGTRTRTFHVSRSTRNLERVPVRVLAKHARDAEGNPGAGCSLLRLCARALYPAQGCKAPAAQDCDSDSDCDCDSDSDCDCDTDCDTDTDTGPGRNLTPRAASPCHPPSFAGSIPAPRGPRR
jgi:hypothetical protein